MPDLLIFIKKQRAHTMPVTLKFSGQCRLSVNTEQKTIELNSARLLTDIIQQHKLTGLCDQDNHFNTAILIFINHQKIAFSPDLTIQPNDTVLFMSPMSGG